jgi:hypothetical protein
MYPHARHTSGMKTDYNTTKKHNIFPAKNVTAPRCGLTVNANDWWSERQKHPIESRQLLHSHWKQRWVSINPMLFLSDTNGSILVHPHASAFFLSPTRVLNIPINSNRNRWNVTADDDGVGAQRMRFMCRESKKVAFVHVTSRWTQGKERVDWVPFNVYALCLHGTMRILVLSNELTMKPISVVIVFR